MLSTVIVFAVVVGVQKIHFASWCPRVIVFGEGQEGCFFGLLCLYHQNRQNRFSILKRHLTSSSPRVTVSAHDEGQEGRFLVYCDFRGSQISSFFNAENAFCELKPFERTFCSRWGSGRLFFSLLR